MDIKTYRVTATIPTAQYGNIIPSIEVGGASSLEEATEFLMPHIEGLWNTYSDKPMTKNSGLENSSRIELDTFTGEKVLFYPKEHVYTTLDGTPLLSGSKFQKKFCEEFNKEMMLDVCEKSWGVDKSTIRDVWNMNSSISTQFGNAVHSAMEIYFKYKEIGEQIQEKKKNQLTNYVIPNHPVLASIVNDFIKKFGKIKGKSITEVVVSSIDRKMVGMIDKVLITDEKKKECWVEDYKTNHDITSKSSGTKFLKEPFDHLENNKLNGYWLQLSFYAFILQYHGWTVKGLRIYNYDNGWSKHESEVLDLTKLNK